MKFPSLIKLPKHRHFNLEPRHYDPIKEELDQRTIEIRQQLEKGQPMRTSISGSFRNQKVQDRKSNLLFLGIAITMMLALWGWWEFGNNVMYGLFAIMPIYLIYRFRGFFRKK